MATIEISGHPTWFDDRPGPGVPVVALHGGLSNSDTLLDPVGAAIGRAHRIVAFDRRGHGRTADTEAPFHYDAMADETIEILDKVVGEPAHLIGWSDGGIVALLVALRRRDLVDRLVLIGVNFHFSGMLEMHIDPEGEFARQIYESYVARSPDGAEHFPVVVDKSQTLFATEPTMTIDELATITAPVLVLVGDDDIIDPQHTVSLFQALSDSQLCVVPGTSHAVPLEKPDLVSRMVLEFLDGPAPPRTLMPNRRQAG